MARTKKNPSADAANMLDGFHKRTIQHNGWCKDIWFDVTGEARSYIQSLYSDLVIEVMCSSTDHIVGVRVLLDSGRTAVKVCYDEYLKEVLVGIVDKF